MKMASMPETGSISTIRIYVEKDEVLVLLDLSGEPRIKEVTETRWSCSAS